MHREAAEVDGTYILHEPSEAYSSDFGGKNDALRPDNTILWEKNTEDTET